jgi:AAA+ superfamily predicted ATPase
MPDPLLDSLRAALSSTPDNLPLRLLLGRSLLERGQAAEAEAVFRAALERAARDAEARAGLAAAFAAQGKHGPALVVCEELIAEGQAGAAVLALAAKAQLRTGDQTKAGRLWKSAKERDPALSDPDLDGLLPRPLRSDGSDGDEGGRGRWDGALERPRIGFAEVGGMEAVKEEIRMKIILPLEKPELFKAYGQRVGGGILLYGPPGCGKTLLARAIAGQVKAGFLSVAISDVLDMYIGQSERNLRDLFASARANRPCVLFFDEVDALAASRRDARHSAGRQVINQFLAELDGVDGGNDGLLVLAATNAPWHLDGAFRRPGRFDRILFVPPPDQPARAAIVRVLLAGRPAAGVDHEAVAKRTEGFSGADLKAVVEQAVAARRRAALAAGAIEPITTRDLIEAAKAVKPSTRDWFATARNHALYANEGGHYDDVLRWLGEKR